MGPERTIEPLSHRHRQFEEGPKIRGSIGANADPKSLYRIPWPSGIPLEGGQLGHYAQSEALDRETQQVGSIYVVSTMRSSETNSMANSESHLGASSNPKVSFC